MFVSPRLTPLTVHGICSQMDCLRLLPCEHKKKSPRIGAKQMSHRSEYSPMLSEVMKDLVGLVVERQKGVTLCPVI